MTDSSVIEITLSKDELDEQVSRLQEEYEWDMYEAEQHYTEVRGMVVDALEKFEYEWSTEVINAFTNVLLAVQIQTDRELEDGTTIGIEGLMDEFAQNKCK